MVGRSDLGTVQAFSAFLTGFPGGAMSRRHVSASRRSTKKPGQRPRPPEPSWLSTNISGSFPMASTPRRLKGASARWRGIRRTYVVSTETGKPPLPARMCREPRATPPARFRGDRRNSPRRARHGRQAELDDIGWKDRARRQRGALCARPHQRKHLYNRGRERDDLRHLYRESAEPRTLPRHIAAPAHPQGARMSGCRYRLHANR